MTIHDFKAREFASAVRYLTLTRQEAVSNLGSIITLDDLLSKLTNGRMSCEPSASIIVMNR
uniref:DNA-binding protein n=1 Tax=Heterorhabditis bacteriophora TaxID=37862 RepID=A0A1I7XE00_HETBA